MCNLLGRWAAEIGLWEQFWKKKYPAIFRDSSERKKPAYSALISLLPLPFFLSGSFISSNKSERFSDPDQLVFSGIWTLPRKLSPYKINCRKAKEGGGRKILLGFGEKTLTIPCCPWKWNATRKKLQDQRKICCLFFHWTENAHRLVSSWPGVLQTWLKLHAMLLAVVGNKLKTSGGHQFVIWGDHLQSICDICGLSISPSPDLTQTCTKLFRMVGGWNSFPACWKLKEMGSKHC